MNRSQINRIQSEAKKFMEEMNFRLPVWAYWHPADWPSDKSNITEIIDNQLGWDITDFGSGDFGLRGLFLFTIRNGNPAYDAKPYAEKIMIVGEGQETPMHYHWSKMEDIINRGGGNLVLELYNSTPEGSLADTEIDVKIDGLLKRFKPGEKVILRPGESICLTQGLYHRFYGQPGKGRVLVGEVSMVNNDSNDNYFLEKVGRFPTIMEDEDPLHLLVSDYQRFNTH